MQSFLGEVAQELWNEYGNQIASLNIVFPSRRARLFFTDELTQIVDHPIWQPQWLSLGELIAPITPLKSGERVRLISELYKIYSTFHKESFDKFYFWGEMLLADFDSIDKYMVDADQLFRNIYDIKEIESDLGYLTPAQLKILSFWASFTEEVNLSEEKKKFLAIWRTLPTIYHQFKARLTQLGIGYGGMIQRLACETIKRGDYAFDPSKKYVVAGFNALSECEKFLLTKLKESAPTQFFWDYDNYYVADENQEGGMFIRENLKSFPPCKSISCDNFVKPKQINVVSTLSNSIQCKHVASLLHELAKKRPLDKKTAIVLTDESLLLPLLHSIPPELTKVNVTMGFPLKQTMAYTFIERLIALQAHARTSGSTTTFYHVDVEGLLHHPYIDNVNNAEAKEIDSEIRRSRKIRIEQDELAKCELLKRVFKPTNNWRDLSNYFVEIIVQVARTPYVGEDQRQRIEFLAVISQAICELHNSLTTCDIELSIEIYTSLLRRHLQSLKVPYQGEPLDGIQVMGILETRNLDFDNVILLSMNDSNFPGNQSAQASFIPYNIRHAFDLPTPEHHEGVYGYYFYRLIQRASHISMVYCSQVDEKTTGEPSRYIHQLHYESPFELKRFNVSVDVNVAKTTPITIVKDDYVRKQLSQFTTQGENQKLLSPTAFFKYVECPLRFYFHSIARLKQQEELSDEVDAPMFGNILHAAMENLYSDHNVVNNPDVAAAIGEILKGNHIEMAVENAINTNYLKTEKKSDYSGDIMVVKEIIIKYIKDGILPYDLRKNNFKVVGTEQRIDYQFPFNSANNKTLKVKFGGIADRIDRLNDGTMRVVDYKTGREKREFKGIDSLFNGKSKERQSNIIQTLIYSMVLYHTKQCDVKPTLYYVRNMNQKEYSSELIDRGAHITGANYSHYSEEFEELLRTKLTEIFDPTIPFTQCDEVESCKYCDFNTICNRK